MDFVNNSHLLLEPGQSGDGVGESAAQVQQNEVVRLHRQGCVLVFLENRLLRAR